MDWSDVLKTLVTGFVGGVGAWFFTDYVAKPLRRFVDLRHEVNRCLVYYGNVQARATLSSDSLRRGPTNISPEEDARLTEAQNAFRDLGAKMRAFVHGYPLANRMVRSCLGYDADQIANALIGYSNSISTYGAPRFATHSQLEKLLRIRAESTPST
jgi:hypothetical protein